MLWSTLSNPYTQDEERIRHSCIRHLYHGHFSTSTYYFGIETQVSIQDVSFELLYVDTPENFSPACRNGQHALAK